MLDISITCECGYLVRGIGIEEIESKMFNHFIPNSNQLCQIAQKNITELWQH